MNQLSTFNLILLVVFGAAMIIGVLIFSGILPGFRAPQGGAGGEVTIWAPWPQGDIAEILDQFRDAHEDEFTLNYVEKDAKTLETELVTELAAGRGPDLVVLPHDSIFRRRENLLAFPYESYPERQFIDTFIKESALYQGTEGIQALPLYVDPLVLYYNVDLISGAGLAQAPKTWKELEAAIKVLTEADQNKNLLRSALPFGKANNINNAQELLSLLILQAGNSISAMDGSNLRIVLTSSGQLKNIAAESLAFFNRFSDPTNALYSWNSAQPEARSAFTRGQAAMYLGFASEYPTIKRLNPQLDIDVSVVPQVSPNTAKTFGRLYGVSLVRGSKNPTTAAQVALALSGAAFSQSLTPALQLPPARVDLLQTSPKDSIQAIFYRSAILSRGWLDPEPTESRKIFQQVIEAAQSGELTPEAAIKLAQDRLTALIKK